MENWKFALSSIRSHKMRSFLTMLGIIIGVAAVVLIMGLGNGMRQSVTDSVTGDKDTVQVYYEAKGEELDPAYADLSHPTKPVKEVWLEQVARQTPGIDSYFVTNSLTSSISLQKKTVKNVNITPLVFSREICPNAALSVTSLFTLITPLLSRLILQAPLRLS